MIPAKDALTICFAHVAYQMKATFDARNTGINAIEVRDKDAFDQRAPEADVIVAKPYPVCGAYTGKRSPART